MRLFDRVSGELGGSWWRLGGSAGSRVQSAAGKDQLEHCCENMSRRLADYLKLMKVTNLYTVLKVSDTASGVYSVVGPVMKPKVMVDSYFKTPYHARRALSPEGEFSQQMMGVKTYKPFFQKVSYFS